jgi:hypothetical protein
MQLKKKQNKEGSVFTGFLVMRDGELLKLKKGMTKQEVILILGVPLRVEDCKSTANEKLIFKINNGNPTPVSYSALFTMEELVYVAKLN